MHVSKPGTAELNSTFPLGVPGCRSNTDSLRNKSALYAHNDISLHLPLASASQKLPGPWMRLARTHFGWLGL